MDDYRQRPAESPLVWCIVCKSLTTNGENSTVMKTIFRLEPSGIYPFGVCSLHKHPMGENSSDKAKNTLENSTELQTTL